MRRLAKSRPTRRDFCAVAGAGLLVASLPACAPNADPRIGEGSLDNAGGGIGGNGSTGRPDGGGGGGGGGSAGGGGGGGGGSAGGGGGGGGGGNSASTDMAGQAPADMASAPACTPGTISAGTASSYTVGGTPKYYKSGSSELFVVRDAGGLYAVSAICTHSGCTNEVQGTQFYCPCHGATFDFNGGNPTSPAHTALKHYAVCVDASGNVTVDGTKSVPVTTRY